MNAGPTKYVACPGCGKERGVKAPTPDEATSELYWKLAAASLCEACCDDNRRARDECPDEALDPDDGSLWPCRLTYHHSGRCEPIVTRAQMLAALERDPS